MNQYLIRFEYEHYCQGYEWAYETVLVYAYSYMDACRRIEKVYRKVNKFENLTINAPE